MSYITSNINGGVVIQVSDWVPSGTDHMLVPKQPVDTKIAAQVGAKILCIIQNQYVDRNHVPFEEQHVI